MMRARIMAARNQRITTHHPCPQFFLISIIHLVNCEFLVWESKYQSTRRRLGEFNNNCITCSEAGSSYFVSVLPTISYLFSSCFFHQSPSRAVGRAASIRTVHVYVSPTALLQWPCRLSRGGCPLQGSGGRSSSRSGSLPIPRYVPPARSPKDSLASSDSARAPRSKADPGQ